MHYISLFNDITEKTLPRFVEELSQIPDGSDLTIQICSAGGLVFDCFGIIDFLKIHKFHTTAEILGYAASASALLALACDPEKMASYTSLMLHSAYTGDGERDEGVERANQVQLQIIRKRCPNYDARELEEKDNWYSSEQAYKLGLVDEVITDTESMVAFCRTFLNSISHKNKENFVMEKELEKKEVIEEKEVAECGDKDVRAAEGEAVSVEDILEAFAKRLDAHDSLLEEIAHRLAVLEGEGKKADDMAEDMEAPEEDVLARRKALYAKLTKVARPSQPVQAKAGAKKSKINLTNFFD